MRWNGLVLFFLLLVIAPAGAQSEKAITLLEHLRAMHVESHWLAEREAIDWQSGDPLPNAPVRRSVHTHCSAFAAAACQRQGIYLLRPPEHSAALLANAQYRWLPVRLGGTTAG